MAYQGKLQSGQTLILENQGEQTVIRLSSGSPGSSGQQQSSSVSTGTWKSQPRVYQSGDGAVVEIKTHDASVFYSVKSGQLQSLDQKPNVDDAETVDLEEVEDGTGKSEMKPMEGMKPMKPM